MRFHSVVIKEKFERLPSVICMFVLFSLPVMRRLKRMLK